jgi:hypothetical protein
VSKLLRQASPDVLNFLLYCQFSIFCEPFSAAIA